MPISERIYTGPEFVSGIDLCNANCGSFGAGFEYPGRRNAVNKLANLVIIQDMDKIGYWNIVFLSLETHGKFVTEMANCSIAHARYAQVFAQVCRSPYIVIIQGNYDVDDASASKKANSTDYFVGF